MPVRKLVRGQRPATAEALKTELLDEWLNPSSTAAEPVILEDGGGGGANQPLHVYVIWDKWHVLSQVERSEIIMDAYEERYGQGRSLNVTVAMGLTAAEADRLGIRYL